MKYDVFYSETARNDLTDIYEYIAFHLMEPLTARKTCAGIISEVRSLETFPERFALFDNEPWRSRGLRKLPVKNYLVFYTVNEEKKTVNVIRIMYGARDLDKHL